MLRLTQSPSSPAASAGRLRSSVSASTVWQPGRGPHCRPVHLPVPLPLLPQHEAPGEKLRASSSALRLSSDRVRERTRTRANSGLVAMASTTIAVARVLLARQQAAPIIVGQILCLAPSTLAVASGGPQATAFPARATRWLGWSHTGEWGLWGTPMASVVDAGGAGASCGGRSTSS